MPPKKESGSQKVVGFIDAVKSGLSILPQVFLPALFSRVHEEADAVLDKFEARALKLQDRMIEKTAIALLFGIGALFLVVSGYFALREYVQLSNAQSFAISGTALLVAGFWMHYRTLKKQKGE